MKRKTKGIMFGLLTLLVLSPALVFAEEVSLKEIKEPDGTMKIVFYSEGKEIAEKIKDKQGDTVKTIGKIPDGLVTQYYDSGRIKAEFNYKNGKREGRSMVFLESGVLQAENKYKNDKRHGTNKIYNKDGSLLVEMLFKNGRASRVKKLYK